MPTVEIEVAGVDYAPITLFSTARFESQVNGLPGEMYMRLRDTDRTLDFILGSPVAVKVDGDVTWRGYVMQQKRLYVFPAVNIDAFGETRFIDLIGVDINILFTKRIVFNVASPTTVAGKLYPPFQPDDDVVNDLVTDYLDLSSDTIDLTTFVDNVGDITNDQEGRAWESGDTWGQAMASIAALPAAIFYLRPTNAGAALVYCDVDTPDAPYEMSDVAAPGIAGYRNMEILFDGTQLVNDQLAWGIGYGSNTPVFVRDQDAASQTEHGLWQAGTVRYGVYKQGTIDRIAASIVDGSPQSKRGAKDDRVAVTLDTWVPGFLPSQKIDFTSEVWGFNDVIPIRKMDLTFEAKDNPKYGLTLSHEIDMPFGFVDPYFLDYSLPPLPTIPPFPVFGGAGSCTPAICGITDDFERTESGTWGIASCGLTWVTGSSGGGTVDVDGSGGTIFLTDPTQPRSMILNAGSGLLPTEVPVNLADIKTMRFQLPDLDLSGGGGCVIRWGATDHTGFVLDPGIYVGTDDTAPGVDSGISFGVLAPSDTLIPPAFWNAASTYTVTQSWNGSSTTLSITDGVDTYSLTGGPEPVVALCQVSFDLNGAIPDTTLRLLDIDIPEITRCTLNVFDLFDRFEALTWGTASSGSVWHMEAEQSTSGTWLMEVTGNRGRLTRSGGTGGFIDMSASLPGDMDSAASFVMEVRSGAWAGSTDVVTLFVGQYTGGDFSHSVLIDNGSSSFSIELLDGLNFDSATVSDFGAASGDLVVKWERNLTLGIARAKAWPPSDDEPDWQVSVSLDGSPDGDLLIIDNANTTRNFSYITIDYDGKPCYPGGPAPVGTPPVGYNGYACENATRVSSSVYSTSSAFIAGTARVWINGVRQRPGGLLDFTEDPVNGEIVFVGPEYPAEDAVVRVCYYIVTSPPT